MIIEYTHPELGGEVTARAGYYVPLEEHILPYAGREVLYVLGHACIDNSCCSMPGNWGYIQVPGFLERKHIRGAGAPNPVSEVELIQDEETRHQIKRLIQDRHPGSQVEIWSGEYAQEPRSA